MQSSQKFNIPIVYDDLRDKFVLKQILSQLQNLDTVVDDVLSRVSKSIDRQQQRIGEIDKRIEKCSEKVIAISMRGTSNKPTTVFSNARYPGKATLENWKHLYHDKSYEENPALELEVDGYVRYLPAQIVTNVQRSQESAEVLDLMNRTNEFKVERNVQVNMAEEGLGPLPDYLPTVGSVLLFNSSENPYQQYSSWDNLLGKDFDTEEEKRKVLAQAPKTLVDGDNLPLVHGLNYEFHPSMGEHSDLSKQLPANLPLENIAEYSYTGDENASSSIAPSMFQDKNLPELPQITNFADEPSVLQPQDNTVRTLVTTDSLTEDAPPPPPSPLQKQQVHRTMEEELPPPPPAIDQVESEMPPPPADTAPPPPPDSPKVAENPRANLLDAIRDAGKNKILRKIENVPKADRPPPKDKPLSIAEEMRLRMSRRQAAISGKQDKMEQRRDRELIQQSKSNASQNGSGLPTLDHSDNESNGQADDEDNDLLHKIQVMGEKQSSADIMQRARADSLELSEASDWSDDD